jgi:uncharacterized protein
MVLAAATMGAAAAAHIPTVPAQAPVYLFRAYDGPKGTGLRQTHLHAHVRYVEANFARYGMAGPILDAQGEMIGSLFIIRAPSLSDAWTLMSAEPYVANGVYGRIETETVRPAAGPWIGGRVWDDSIYSR